MVGAPVDDEFTTTQYDHRMITIAIKYDDLNREAEITPAAPQGGCGYSATSLLWQTVAMHSSRKSSGNELMC